MERTTSLHPMLGELKERLQALYGDRLRHLVLFGSQARGDATEDSDYDIMVVLDGPVNKFEEVRRIVKITAALRLEHDEFIQIVPMSRDEFEEGKKPLIQNVRREGIIL